MSTRLGETICASRLAVWDGGGARLLQRLAAHRRWIWVTIAALLVLLIGLDFITSWWSTAIPSGIAGQFELTGRFTVAAVFEALVGLAAGGVALLLAIRHQAGRRLAWAAIGVSCIAAALADLFILHPSRLALALAVAILGSLVFGLILACAWSVPGALRLAALSVLLLASNPVTEALEIEIAGDPSNYRYIAADEPYVLTSSAWHWLWITSRLQESGEVIAMILLLQCFLMAAALVPVRCAGGAAPYYEAAPTPSNRSDIEGGSDPALSPSDTRR